MGVQTNPPSEGIDEDFLDDLAEIDEEEGLLSEAPARSFTEGTLPSVQRQNSSLHEKIGNVVRWLSESLVGNEDSRLTKTLMENLRSSTLFRYCSEANLLALAQSMERVDFKKGDVLMVQGEAQSKAIVLVSGEVVRLRLVDDQLHVTQTLGAVSSGASIGMLHLLKQESTFATVKCISNGSAYVLSSETLRDLLESDPAFTNEVIHSLCKEVRNHSKHSRTPLFLQSGKALPAAPLPWFAVSCASAIESFYRSALNSMLNAQLTGKQGALFPNMHIQLPSRILYINGFKGIRHVLDSKFDPNDNPYRDVVDPNIIGMGLAVVPGLMMTPLSSLLEASNAGHMNSEPMQVRWTRGFAPRCLREVIFGVGINQLSDYVEERLDFIPNQTMQNICGSLLAGVTAGYLSHVPHNLSALKMLQPNKTYGQHFQSLGSHWRRKVQHTFPEAPRMVQSAMINTLSCVAPKGCLIRTAQIAGSFVIINSAVNALKHISVNVSVSRAGI